MRSRKRSGAGAHGGASAAHRRRRPRQHTKGGGQAPRAVLLPLLLGHHQWLPPPRVAIVICHILALRRTRRGGRLHSLVSLSAKLPASSLFTTGALLPTLCCCSVSRLSFAPKRKSECSLLLPSALAPTSSHARSNEYSIINTSTVALLYIDT